MPKVKIRGIPLGGQLLQIGPMSNREFPWVLLDRCLLLLDFVSRQPHAFRGHVQLGGSEPRRLVSGFASSLRNRFERVFRCLRKGASAEEIEWAKIELVELLQAWWEEREIDSA